MPRSHWGVAWRGVLAFVVVVACAAGATATAGLLKVNDFVGKLNLTKPLATKELVLPAPGKPETLLLVGVDHRYGEGDGPGNTDTMMLVRIDDSSTTINTLSIPRDLGVQIPGTTGISKLNAAYADDGETLLIKTLREDVFPKLKVNHVLIVDFASFSNLINAIGCVYVQVDHRYYNHSEGALNPATDYSSIYIQPGYQKLCGGSGSNLGGPDTALAFVRFRHNDNDFVRQARQQDFLRWAKQNFSSSELLSKQNVLLTDFGKDVQTDGNLHRTDGLLDLFNLAINANGSAQKSIPFPDDGTENVGGADDVILDEAQAEAAYKRFMTPTIAPAGGSSTTTTPTTTTPPVTKGKHHHAKVRVYTPPAYMAADSGDGNSQAAHLGHSGLPVYYPKYIPTNFAYCYSISGNCDIGYEVQVDPQAYAASYPRHYKIDGFGGKKYPSYVMTLVYSSGGESDTATGEYASVQGTTWPGAGHAAGPPILRTGYVTKVVNGKLLYVYSQGGRFAVVAWKTKGGVYWISNTLQNDIPNDQMVAMAASFTRAH
jgi:LCP family protein required for cell wall assembly